jgi:hypothetical protein
MDLSEVTLQFKNDVSTVKDGETIIHRGSSPQSLSFHSAVYRKMFSEGYTPVIRGGVIHFMKIT